MPERLPAGGADGRGGFFQRPAHGLEHRLDHAEGQRKRHEDVGQDDRVGREHQLMAFGRKYEAAQRSRRSPEKQQSESRVRCRNRGRQRDGDDDGRAPPKVVTRQHIGGEEAEDDVKDRGPETRHHRELQGKDSLGRGQRGPETTQPFARPEDEDRQQWQQYERQHNCDDGRNTDGPHDIEAAHVSQG